MKLVAISQGRFSFGEPLNAPSKRKEPQKHDPDNHQDASSRLLLLAPCRGRRARPLALERDFSGGRDAIRGMSQMISALERAKMGEMCGKLYFLETMPYSCLLL